MSNHKIVSLTENATIFSHFEFIKKRLIVQNIEDEGSFDIRNKHQMKKNR